jgi:hypothetical protein
VIDCNERKREKRHEFTNTGELKTTRIMMATERHVTSSSGLKKFQAAWFLLNRGYQSTEKREIITYIQWERNILPTIKGGSLTGLGATCLLKLIIEGQIEREIKWREDEEESLSSYWMNSKEGKRSCKLKEEALYLNLWKICVGRGKGPLVRQTKKRMNKCR